MFELRKYQGEAVVEGMKFFLNEKRKKPSYMVLPTAAGKSIVIAYLAKELEEPVLCLQPTKELLEQNYNKFISYGGKASIFSASKNIKEISEVTFATIGSIYKDPEKFKMFKYVIIDECHLVSPNGETEDRKASMYINFLSKLKVKILGLTATPFRTRYYQMPEPYSVSVMLHRSRPRLFEDIIHVTQIQELVSEGYWSDIEYISVPFKRENIETNSKGSNFLEVSVDRELKKQGAITSAINYALELKNAGYRKVLIFAPSVAVADYIAMKLRIDSISSETPKLIREDSLKRLKNGEAWGIVNVNVLSVGFDDPEIDAIVDLNPTMSLSRYYQKLGRGIRISSGKKFCLVIDLVGNYKVFGAIERINFKQVKDKWCVFCGDKNVSEIVPFEIKKVPDFDYKEVTYGKYAGKKYKEIPMWYLKFVNTKLTETPDNKELKEYAKLKL